MAKTGEKSIKSAAEQVVAAGRTAVEKAQEAVDKAQKEGEKIIQSLAKESEKIRKQTQKLAEGAVNEVKEKVEEVTGKASDTLSNLEKIFEERVSRVLNRLGVPTSSDFQEIATRIEELNQSVQALIKSKRSGGAVTPAATEDDLKAIAGIGPSMEAKLNAAGISSYRQIVELSPADIERIETDVIHYSGRFRRDKWVEQAKQLHLQKYQEQL